MKLETLLAKAPKPDSNIRSKVITIDTAFAVECLKQFNNSNRPLTPGLAKLYENEMLRGAWKVNGEPIIFSVDSKGVEHLISGQHRLAAVRSAAARLQIDGAEKWPVAQTEFVTVVITGVDHDTADTVDTGKNRSHGDVLFRDPWVDSIIPESWNETIGHRKTWTKTLAGAARLVWLIDGGAIVSSSPKFVISEMLTFLQTKHPELGKFVTMVLDANSADGGNKGLKMSLPYLAALSYVASIDTDEDGAVVVNEDNADKFDAFLNELAVGTGYEKGSPAWALAGYWNKLASEVGSKDRDREWVGPFVKAGMAMLNDTTGMKVSDIQLSKKERDNYADFPIMFDGYHTICFEAAAEEKANRAQALVDAREKAVAAKQAALDAAAAAKQAAAEQKQADKEAADLQKQADAEKKIADAKANASTIKTPAKKAATQPQRPAKRSATKPTTKA